jgi:hypothetical protein
MDGQGKKILCCGRLQFLLNAYGDLSHGIPVEMLNKLNAAADRAIEALEPAVVEASKVYEA